MREYTSRRASIVNAIVDKLKLINGKDEYNSDVEERVSNRLLFWDEVNEYPSVHVNAGQEYRQYQTAGYKDRFLVITIRAYIRDEDSISSIEGLVEDIETVLEQNSRLAYEDKRGNTQYTQQITIDSIDTDEGVLAPLGVAELTCTVRY